MSDSIYCTLDSPIAVKEPETPYDKALASINVSAYIDVTMAISFIA